MKTRCISSLLLTWLLAVVQLSALAVDVALSETEVVESGTDETLPESLAATVLKARALLERADVRGALEQYRLAWKIDPGNYEVGLRLVEVTLMAGQAQEALEILVELGDADPTDRAVAVQRARLLLALNHEEEGRELTEQLYSLHPDDPEVLLLWADLSENTSEWNEAIKAVEMLLLESPHDPALWYRLGRLHVINQQPMRAEAAWMRLLDESPGDEQGIDALTELLRSEGRGDDLLALLEDLYAQGELNSAHQARLADLYLEQENYEGAVALLAPLAASGELEPQAQLLLAELFVNLDRQADALDVLEDMVDEGLSGASIRRALGDVYYRLGELDSAKEHLTIAIGEDPRDIDAIVTLLLVLSSQSNSALDAGNGAKAEQKQFDALLGRAFEGAHPQSLRQNFVVGALLRRRGQFPQAIRLLERAELIDPESEDILYELAVTRESLGDYEVAAGILDRLIELDPDSPHLLNFYGYLLAEQGWELERAREMIERALEHQPDNGAYVDSLGWVLYRQGHLEEAFDQLVRAVNLVGDDPVILEHLGDVLRDMGKLEESERAYRRALAVGGDEARLRDRLDSLNEE